MVAAALVLPHAVPAQSANREPEQARAFAQSFYDWYLNGQLPASAPSPRQADSDAIAQRRMLNYFLSPELFTRIVRSERQQATVDEITGLDVDPFLNASDFLGTYATRVQSNLPGGYKIAVFDSDELPPRNEVHVFVDVIRQNGNWRIADFEYPQGESLLQMLGRGEMAQNFVQGFYDWYLILCTSVHGKDELLQALRERPDYFSKRLRTALLADRQAAQKSHGEIDGLDFDPFLNAQDLRDRYQVGTAKQDGEVFMVPVFGVDAGKVMPAPDVIVEVKFVEGRWVILNFNDPHGYNLLKLLERYAAQRRHSH